MFVHFSTIDTGQWVVNFECLLNFSRADLLTNLISPNRICFINTINICKIKAFRNLYAKDKVFSSLDLNWCPNISRRCIVIDIKII